MTQPSRVQSQRLRIVAQAVWIVLAGLSIALFIAAMPRYYHQGLTLTNNDGFIPRDPVEWKTGLHQLGLSPSFYAIYIVVGRSVLALSLVLTGFLIFWHRSRDWYSLFLGLTLLVFGCTTPPVNAEFDHSSVAPVVQLLASFGQMFFVALYVFPDGRFVPRWTRWIALVVVVSVAAPYSALNKAALPVLGITLLIAPTYRYRSIATPEQRQQMKWALTGLCLAAVIVVVDVLLYSLLPGLISTDRSRVLYDLATLAAVVIGFSLVPICVGIAILRYHLWEIDVVINRALVYGSLTLTLLVLYIAGVVAVQALFRAITGQRSEIAVAIVTLVIAALFNPWRRRLQTFIDRRFYRHKYDAAKALASLNARLRDEVDLDRLRADLVTTVRDTVEPSSVALWLR